MRSNKWSIENKNLLLTSYFLLLIFAISCGKRGDPVAIIPYKEVGVVKDLKVSIRDDNIYLTWGMPLGKNFSEKALKGFVVFRAEVPEGVSAEKCECEFISLDFVIPDKKGPFEYLDKKAIKGHSYIYKLTVMDKNNFMGKDSNSVFASLDQPEIEETITPPDAPARLNAVYTQRNVVLTWDEMREQEINIYRVYRSEGKDFILVGESVTPAFTDSKIEHSKKYYYRVTAVGKAEGPPSQEIEVETKGD